jgi:hypothetical protein
VLHNKEEEEEEEDPSGGESEEEQDEPDKKSEPLCDEFVPNPEQQRAKAERWRQRQTLSHARHFRGAQAKDRDVVGV